MLDGKHPGSTNTRYHASNPQLYLPSSVLPLSLSSRTVTARQQSTPEKDALRQSESTTLRPLSLGEQRLVPFPVSEFRDMGII